jgi:hypothetical protein
MPRDVVVGRTLFCVLALGSGALVSFAGQEPASVGAARPAPYVVPEYVAPPPARLTARTVREYDAPEADQGVAVDRTHFYAVDNTVIGKYEIASGRFVTRWIGPRSGLIRHMNSCRVDGSRLQCANSNYSLTPMGSSIETFDVSSLTHVETHSLGLRDEGSLTWLDRYRGGWLAAFAHYDDNGGVPFKNHSYSNVVTFDAEWRRTGGWLFPESVVARLAPDAASGGAIGPDGFLYILGHDRPEMYVLARPSMGPTMVHVATIDLEVAGQAFAWAPGPGRRVFAIDRRRLLVRAIDLPSVTVTDASALPFH